MIPKIANQGQGKFLTGKASSLQPLQTELTVLWHSLQRTSLASFPHCSKNRGPEQSQVRERLGVHRTGTRNPRAIEAIPKRSKRARKDQTNSWIFELPWDWFQIWGEKGDY